MSHLEELHMILIADPPPKPSKVTVSKGLTLSKSNIVVSSGIQGKLLAMIPYKIQSHLLSIFNVNLRIPNIEE